MIGGEDMYKPMCRECYHAVAQDIARREAEHESAQAAEVNSQNSEEKVSLRVNVLEKNIEVGTASNSPSVEENMNTPEK
jgi:hypothetical protein